MTVTICRVMGFILLAVGVLGFPAPNLLGMHLTPMHNVVHLASGALALYFGYAATAGARGFALTFGAVYFLLGVLGFAAPDLVARLIGHPPTADARALTPDNVVHLILGGTFLAAGWARGRLPRRARVA
jgi:hypothetical protein